jgi:hypothetical protein
VTPTKGEIPKLLASFDLLAFFNGSFDAANHHGTNTYSHDAPESRTVNGNYLANVFAINVESCSYGLGLG